MESEPLSKKALIIAQVIGGLPVLAVMGLVLSYIIAMNNTINSLTEARVDTINERIRVLEDRLKSKDEEIDRKDKHLKDMEKKLTKEIELINLGLKNKLESHRDELNKELGNKERQFSSERRALEQRIVQLENEKENIEKQLEKAISDKEIVDLNAKKALITKEEAESRIELELVKIREQAVKESQKFIKTIEDLENSKNILGDKIAMLSGDNEGLKKLIGAKDESIENLKNVEKKNIDLLENFSKLESRLETLLVDVKTSISLHKNDKP